MKIAFDMNGAIFGDGNHPSQPTINLLYWFSNMGWDIVLWSGLGINDTKRYANALFLHFPVIEQFSEEVDIVVDKPIKSYGAGVVHLIRGIIGGQLRSVEFYPFKITDSPIKYFCVEKKND